MSGLTGLTTGTAPVWLEHPADTRRQVGQEVVLSGRVEGSPPFELQWYFEGQPIPGAHSAELRLKSVQVANAGSYAVVAQNRLASVSSRAAFLDVTADTAGGEFLFVSAGADAVVLAMDGTPLTGAHFAAQLWAGPTQAALLAVGLPATLLDPPAAAGTWDPGPDPVRIAGNVAPGVPAYCVIRAWDTTAGATYEEAATAGGQTGESAMFVVTSGGWGEPPSAPAALEGLTAFAVRQPTPQILSRSPDLLVQSNDPVVLEVEVWPMIGVEISWRRQNSSGSWETLASGPSAQLWLQPALSNVTGVYEVSAVNASGRRSRGVTILVFQAPHVTLGPPGWERIQLELTGPGGPPFVIETSPDLRDWVAIYQTSEPAETLVFADPSADGLPSRFYRARSLASGEIVSRAAFGFTEIVVGCGFSLVGNPLLTGNDTVAGLFGDLPDGSIVYKHDPTGGFSINIKDFDMWARPDETVNPGEGVFVRNSQPQVCHLVVTGEVPEGPQLIVIPEGWSIHASPAPLSGRVDTVLGVPLERDDNVDLLDQGALHYRAFVYDGDGGWYTGDDLTSREAPAVEVGEGFWVYAWESRAWIFDYRSRN